MPSMVNAYSYNGGNPMMFSENSLISGNTMQQCNYGLYPLNLMVPINGEEVELSWRTIVKRYKFMSDYKALLLEGRSCRNVPYLSASEYCEYNAKGATDETLEYYTELDNTYKEYGGDITYEWMSMFCFQKYIIPWGEGENDAPIECYEEWGTDFLYYFDILQWRKWFEETKKQCKELYKLKGGDKMYKWLKSVVFQGTPEQKDYRDAHILIPLYIQNTIDDMGEFSLMDEEWEKGETYSKGSVVTYNDNTYIATDDTDVNTPNQSTKWMQYQKHDTESLILLYAFKDNILHIGATIKELAVNMADTYPIIKATWQDTSLFMIQGKIYESKQLDYVVYQVNAANAVQQRFNGKKFIVKYEKVSGNQLVPYVVVHGRTIYANSNNQFIFDSRSKIACDIQKGEFILFENEYYSVENKQICLEHKTNSIKETYTYSPIDGYITINDNILPIKNDRTVELSLTDTTYDFTQTNKTIVGDYVDDRLIINENTNGYYIDNGILYSFKPFQYHKKDEVTGETESKLSSLITTLIAMDDLGNELPGIFTKNKDVYVKPLENDWIDLYYEVGNFSHIMKLSDDKFYGNLLTSMTFYYLKEDGTKYKVLTLSNMDKYKSSKEIYELMIDKYNEYYNENPNIRLQKDIKCDVEYHIGAILTKKGDNFKVDTTIPQNYGVKYIDTLTLTPKTWVYWASEMIQYPINYLEVRYETISTANNEHDNAIITVNKSYFTYYPNIIEEETNVPILRKEHLFGISCKEKVIGDIYIDRGVSHAFTHHLKLGEVKTLESLEQYGNNSFNIENS